MMFTSLVNLYVHVMKLRAVFVSGKINYAVWMINFEHISCNDANGFNSEGE